MKLAMVGLGRMGGNMVKRLEQDGHELASYARSGGGTASSLEELVGQLEPTRVVWLMIPTGEATERAFPGFL
ncbi:MAG: NAD(P)-binding domain-containing protein, partial [Gaiellaceae bacterium]